MNPTMEADLFTWQSAYPSAPGWKGTDTSRDAAPSAEEAYKVRQAILEAVRKYPMTSDEASAYVGVSPAYGRPRMSELRTEGKVEPSGLKRRNASGKPATVWRAV